MNFFNPIGSTFSSQNIEEPKCDDILKKSFLISFNLNKSDKKNILLITSIEDLGECCHVMENTFIVRSSSNAEMIRDHLKQFIHKNDQLLVIRLTGEGAWNGFDVNNREWLLNNLK